jgi:hypothetical protein
MDCCVRRGSRVCENFARYNHTQNFEACGHAQSKKCEWRSLGQFLPPSFVAGGDSCSAETGRQGGWPWLRLRAMTGHSEHFQPGGHIR